MADLLFAESLKCADIFARAQGWHKVGDNVFQKRNGITVYLATRAKAFHGLNVSTVHFAPCSAKLEEYGQIWEFAKARSNDVNFLPELT